MKTYRIITQITVSCEEDRQVLNAIQKAISKTLDNASFLSGKDEILDNISISSGDKAEVDSDVTKDEAKYWYEIGAAEGILRRPNFNTAWDQFKLNN